ncbi:aminotransferase class III-fold pyridoxal phosphate-dependent enzyme [Cyclobacterium jeungdonense]|uniref:Aminotransferase class III-fold pyridoxal phosphate-dependent enzyme n=1 Tax=Cyclobacterium jeungdonense TaxID=708087 RepID=A0ABT8C8C8_9BACT|nr:aminotransferase class III-fold pyridoxal phosphate-dependent enzyme [Cyclobacterium jeungdonense]MDN3688781.1 aminotransferase class III-fold pyridoxal phosphate-dependent enzyme [Cyclobacterium jeungdonense]
MKKNKQSEYTWDFSEKDREVLAGISDFLPERVWDSHAHIYQTADLSLQEPGLWSGGPASVSIPVWESQVKPMFPKSRLEGGLFFPAPLPQADVQAANAFLRQQLDQHPHCRGLALIRPEMRPEEMAETLDHHRILGLKPYHVYSPEKPTPRSSIHGFLPNHWCKWAHEKGAVVMLHLVKDRAISDPSNQETIRKMCLDYPGMKLVLAHTARSFHAPHAAGIAALKDLPNIWFDMSGICEPQAMMTVLHHFGPQKLLWGSDFPVSSIRGKAVTLGDGFFWLDGHACNWNKALGHPVLVGIESLRALKEACEWMSLNANDRQDIFCTNGIRLLGCDEKSVLVDQDLYRHAKSRIPGGVQLLSKRPENMAPEHWPPYFREARGCEVWDLDGRHYYDFSTNAVGSCLLGYAHPAVNDAVMRRIRLGSMSSLNAPEEVALADELCALHSWAEQARFVRGGGEACGLAIRIARATTGRSLVGICGYHGWQDWYLAANLGSEDALKGHLLPGLEPAGVPEALRGSAFTFRFNDTEGFLELIKTHGNRLAAVIMEPGRQEEPLPGFLERVREETQKYGILLIVDEITAGWRMHMGGLHLRYGLHPDMAVFAKALGNGFPIGAVIGSREAMEGAHRSFMSSTSWSESTGPVAALATLKEMKRFDLPLWVEARGKEVQKQWKELAEKWKLPVEVYGFPALSGFRFSHPASERLRTIFTREMLKQGFLAGTAFYPSLGHTEQNVKKYGEALDQVFAVLSKSLEKGTYISLPDEEVAKSGFSRLV